MKTTFSRTFASAALILLAALLLVGISFQLLVKNYLTKHAIERLQGDASTLASLATAYHNEGSFQSEAFLVNLSVAAQVSDADVVICDTTGTVVLCSDAPLGCEHQGMRITNTDYLGTGETCALFCRSCVPRNAHARNATAPCVERPRQVEMWQRNVRIESERGGGECIPHSVADVDHLHICPVHDRVKCAHACAYALHYRLSYLGRKRSRPCCSLRE